MSRSKLPSLEDQVADVSVTQIHKATKPRKKKIDYGMNIMLPLLLVENTVA